MKRWRSGKRRGRKSRSPAPPKIQSATDDCGIGFDEGHPVDPRGPKVKFSGKKFQLQMEEADRRA